MKNRTLSTATLFLAGAAVTLAGTSTLLAGDVPIWEQEIRRESLNTTRRTKLTQLELKPAPADLFSSLTNWTGGSELTSDSTRGRPVLIFTFASWEPNSQTAFKKAVRAAKEQKDLVVVAVHGEKMWDEAVAFAKEQNFTGLLAQDSGQFRAKLMIDQEPDFYLIDRAGNMRFADFETDSVSKAVERVMGETPEVAASQATLLKAHLAQVKREFETPKAASEILRPKALGKVEFKFPDSGVYEKAAWPEKNKNQQAIGANDIQGQKLPNADEFGQKELWITDKPDWSGKVIILDFWATWCVPCKRAMPMIEDLQRKYKDDLCVIGITGQGESDKTVEQYLRGKEVVYAHCYDTKMFENEQRQTLAEKISLRGIPHVIIISTDGIVRWQGHPLDPNFRRLAELIIEIDPGVQARRAAEAEARKAAGG
ncbi:MAG: TlpA family protein disulfide reductase [Phycisphaerales bacterium]